MRRCPTTPRRAGQGRRTPKCSEAAPKSLRGPSGGAPGQRGQAPRGCRHGLGRGPTRSDRGLTRSDTARRSGRRKPGAAPSIAKYRSGRPVRRDLARTGRNSQVGGAVPGERRPPPKYRQVSRVPVTSRAGRWPPPAGRSRRELPCPLRRRGGCRAGRRRVKGPQNPSTAPACGAGGGSGQGPFRRLLDAPLPGALPAGRPEASALASGGRGPEEGKAIMSHFSVLVLTGEGQDVEGLLLPYMENRCGEPPREYMEFFEDEECEVDEERGARGGADGRRGELRRRARGRLRPRAALRGPRSAARHGVPPEVRPHGERRALGRGEQLRPGRGGASPSAGAAGGSCSPRRRRSAR